MMVALTSVTPHSSSSCLQSKLYPPNPPPPPFISYENTSSSIAINPYPLKSSSSSSSSTRRRFTIRSAATKPAKTPGNFSFIYVMESTNLSYPNLNYFFFFSGRRMEDKEGAPSTEKGNSCT